MTLGLGAVDPRALVYDKLGAFRSFVLLHGAARSYGRVPFVEEVTPLLYGLAGVWLAVCLALSFGRRTAPLTPWLALPALLLQLAWTFPYTDNHFFLELLAVGVLCFLPRSRAAGRAVAASRGRKGRRREERDEQRDEADARLVLQGLQWLTLIVLFHTGLQKLLHGWYFGGEFLAVMVGLQGRFSDLFGIILPAEEVARLQSYDPAEIGAGPYRVDFLPFVLLSNGVWIAEMVLPCFMAWTRTRTLATVAALLLVFSIELGAHEIGFALLYTNLLLLFLPGPWPRRALPVSAAAYAYLLAEIHGWLPFAWLGSHPYL